MMRKFESRANKFENNFCYTESQKSYRKFHGIEINNYSIYYKLSSIHCYNQALFDENVKLS